MTSPRRVAREFGRILGLHVAGPPGAFVAQPFGMSSGGGYVRRDSPIPARIPVLDPWARPGPIPPRIPTPIPRRIALPTPASAGTPTGISAPFDTFEK